MIIDVRQPSDKDEEKYRRTIAALLETLAAHPDLPRLIEIVRASMARHADHARTLSAEAGSKSNSSSLTNELENDALTLVTSPYSGDPPSESASPDP